MGNDKGMIQQLMLYRHCTGRHWDERHHLRYLHTYHVYSLIYYVNVPVGVLATSRVNILYSFHDNFACIIQTVWSLKFLDYQRQKPATSDFRNPPSGLQNGLSCYRHRKKHLGDNVGFKSGQKCLLLSNQKQLTIFLSIAVLPVPSALVSVNRTGCHF